MTAIPDPGGAGVTAVLAAADATAARQPLRLLGSRDAAICDAAEAALDDVDDWARDVWWVR